MALPEMTSHWSCFIKVKPALCFLYWTMDLEQFQVWCSIWNLYLLGLHRMYSVEKKTHKRSGKRDNMMLLVCDILTGTSQSWMELMFALCWYNGHGEVAAEQHITYRIDLWKKKILWKVRDMKGRYWSSQKSCWLKSGRSASSIMANQWMHSDKVRVRHKDIL